MFKPVFLCVLVCLAKAQQDDDGQYYPEKYEVPYQGETNQLTQGYQQPAYRPQPQAYQPQTYQQPQAQAYRPQSNYQSDPRQAAILSEERYLSNDGKFGASYSQEDGVEFKEEAQPDGTRVGQYSWVDPSGQRRTVSYTAGKHGFQASGDHLPQGPAQQPQPQAQPQYRAQPQPQYQAPAQPLYRPQPQPQQQYRPQPQPQYRAQPQAQPQYRPQSRAQQGQYDDSQQDYVDNGPVTFPEVAHPDVSQSSATGYTITSSF